jgi:pyrroline-5-carboxylate reductase
MADTRTLLLVGGGRMGSALLKGWIARGLTPVVVIEPDPSTELKRVAGRARVVIARDLARTRLSTIQACVVALKPQVLKIEAAHLRDVARSGATMISIAAGTTTKALASAWGPKAHIVRAMPNTPGAVGRGISGLFASGAVAAKDRKLAEELLSALGATVWLKKESDLDAVTAVSASGPAYVFLLVEVLAEAARREGLPQAVAAKLARATVTGAGVLLDTETAEPEALRRAVTSPGGTTAAALEILMAPNGLSQLIARAVSAARKRAKELGE